MCFNKDISLISYIIGTLSSIFLYLRGYKIEGILYGFIVQMQLIEYLLWLNNSCNNINKIITKIGILLNHLQPIVLYLLIVYFNNKIKNYYIHHIIIIIYIILTIIYLIYNNKLLENCTIGIPNKQELKWSIHYGNQKKYYYIFLFTLISLTIIGFKKYNYLNAYLILLIYLISYIKYNKTKSVGTIWCLFAAYMPVLLNIIYFI